MPSEISPRKANSGPCAKRICLIMAASFGHWAKELTWHSRAEKRKGINHHHLSHLSHPWKCYHLKGLPHIRSSFSSSVHVQKCPLFLMAEFLLHTACVILKSLRGTEGAPTYGKMHNCTKQSLNHWPGYSSVLLNQYIKPVPTRHLIYPENIWNSYKVLSSIVLQKLPQKTYRYQWTNKQNK